MAFPDTDLDIIIQAYIGADPADAPGTWPAPVDWSDRLLDKDLTVFRGRRTNQNTAASGSCTFWLDDSDLDLATSDLTGTPVSVEVDNVGASPPYGRFHGYIVNVESEVIRGAGGHEIVTAKVTLGGIMRQRTQGAKVYSPLYRAHRPTGILADSLYWYWSLENATSGELSTTQARHRIRLSPLGTGSGQTKRYARAATAAFEHFTFGSAGWSSEAPDGASGSVALSSAAMSFGRMAVTGRIPVIEFPSPSSPIRFGFAFKFADDLPDAPNDPGEKECTILRTVDPDNDNRAWAVRLITSSSGTVYNLDTFTINDAGTATHHSVTPVTLSLSVWHYITLQLSSSGGGADTAYRLVLDGELIHSGTASGVAYADSVDISVVNAGIDVPGLSNIDHFAIWNGSSLPDEDAGFVAMNGHRDEQAHDRIDRVFTEDGIPYTSTATESQMCGAQPIADSITIARDAELVDHGILAEDITTWGLTYRAGRQRYAQDAAFTIDLASYRVAEGEARPVLRPTRNDSRLRNEWTISRPGGSSVTVRDAASIAAKGTYDDEATVNVADDDQLEPEGHWRLHEGTYEGRRWGSVPVNFGENLTLLTGWLDTELGDRFDRTGHALTYLERLDVQGYTERLRRTKWAADLYVEPYAIFDTGTYQDTDASGDVPRYDTEWSTTASGLWLPGSSGAYASTPDDSELDITGDCSLRADVTLRDWATGSEQSLISKWEITGNQRAYRLFVDTDGTLCFARSPNGIVTGSAAEFNSTVAPTVPLSGRLSVRADFDADNGASGCTVTFYTSTDTDLTDATWTQLGSTVTKAGTSSIFDSSADLEVGSFEAGTAALVDGVVHAVQVRGPSGAGSVRANARFDEQATGTTSFVDTPGRTWTVQGDADIVGAPTTGTDTDLIVVTSVFPYWTVDPPGGWPILIKAAGVVLSVTGIAESTSPQRFTISATVPNGVVKQIPAGTEVRVFRPPHYGL